MKLTEQLNNKLKEAVQAVRQPGEPVEVYWADDDGPFDVAGREEWGGDLLGISELRKWLSKNEPDGRTATIYCRGDYRDIVLI